MTEGLIRPQFQGDRVYGVQEDVGGVWGRLDSLQSQSGSQEKKWAQDLTLPPATLHLLKVLPPCQTSVPVEGPHVQTQAPVCDIDT